MPNFVQGLILGLCIGIIMGLLSGQFSVLNPNIRHTIKMAVESNCGQYNSKTGNFEWIKKVNK